MRKSRKIALSLSLSLDEVDELFPPSIPILSLFFLLPDEELSPSLSY